MTKPAPRAGDGKRSTAASAGVRNGGVVVAG
jgi:hypothetical protein